MRVLTVFLFALPVWEALRTPCKASGAFLWPFGCRVVGWGLLVLVWSPGAFWGLPCLLGLPSAFSGPWNFLSLLRGLFWCLTAMLLPDFFTVKDEGLLHELFAMKRVQCLFILSLRV